MRRSARWPAGRSLRGAKTIYAASRVRQSPPPRAAPPCRISSREASASHGACLKAVVAQHEGQPREQVQVRADRRAHDREEDVDRLAVDRVEVDRLLQEAERDRRGARRAARSGCARAGWRCRRRSPVEPSDSRARRTWSRNSRSTSSGSRIRSTTDWSTADLSAPAMPVVDPACLQGLGQARQRSALALLRARGSRPRRHPLAVAHSRSSARLKRYCSFSR